MEKIKIIIQAARLYYEHDLNQQAIAKKLNISRPYVSKLLQQAKDLGIVKITINDGVGVESEMERKIKQVFGLKKVIIIPVEEKKIDNIPVRLGQAVARYLQDILKDGDVIGVAWGTTMYACAQQLIGKDLANIKIVQMDGGITRLDKNIYVNEILMSYAKAFNALPYFLQLPAIVDSEEMKNTIIRDRSISKVIDLANKSNIALFSVGDFGYNSILVKADYFTPREVAEFLEQGVVGDICSRLVTIKGQLKDDSINNRCIAIELDELKKKEYSILVASGEGKAKGIYAAIKNNYSNVLVTDENTIQTVLKIHERYSM